MRVGQRRGGYPDAAEPNVPFRAFRQVCRVGAQRSLAERGVRDAEGPAPIIPRWSDFVRCEGPCWLHANNGEQGAFILPLAPASDSVESPTSVGPLPPGERESTRPS